MNHKTHLAFAFLLALSALLLFAQQNQLLFVLAFLIGSLAPDIDHPKSKLGKHMRPLHIFFTHRGFFHSIFALLILYVISTFTQSAYIFAFIIGYASHLFLDMLTKKGIMPFHPLTDYRMNGWIKTGGVVEKSFLLILIFFDVLLLFAL